MSKKVNLDSHNSSLHLFLLPHFLSSLLVFPTPLCLTLLSSLWREEICTLHKQRRQQAGMKWFTVWREREKKKRKGLRSFTPLHHFLSHQFFCCWRLDLICVICSSLSIRPSVCLSVSFLHLLLIVAMMALRTIMTFSTLLLVTSGKCTFFLGPAEFLEGRTRPEQTWS